MGSRVRAAYVLPRRITVKLTDTTVRTYILPDGKADVIVFDDKLKGFGLRIRPTGRKWVVQYRDSLSANRRFNIGSTQEVTATKARETAARLLAGCKLGRYPHVAREERRKEAERARDLAGETFRSIAELYLQRQQLELRPKSFVGCKQHIERTWACFNRVSIHAITRRQVADRLAEVAEESGPVSANRARSHLAAMFSWAMRDGRCNDNPAHWVNKFKETPRDRVLEDHELRAVWLATDDDSAHSRIVRVLLLTGLRRTEVSQLRWSEIDYDKGLITIPNERSKSKRAHLVPMMSEVITILRSTPRIGGDAVFGKGKGFDGFGPAKRALDKRVAEMAGAPVVPWTLHDLRRTLRSALTQKLGIEQNVSESVLGHIRTGVLGVYDVGHYLAGKTQALGLWADHVDTIVNNRRDRTVVSLRRPGA
jgi:integrase